jgi:hypothetical protein
MHLSITYAYIYNATYLFYIKENFLCTSGFPEFSKRKGISFRDNCIHSDSKSVTVLRNIPIKLAYIHGNI